MRDAVIGLEVHVQLSTSSKMFCGCASRFGDPPNSRVCPVCLGLPGALPVANRRAVELAVRAAVGLRCTVHPRSRFARKSYFYPDLPKGYQITQHEHPLATGGGLDLPRGGRVRIRRIHLEEDTGRSLHDRVPGATALDLNRAGTPLIEIVTEPDLRSPEDARALLLRLRQALLYLDVSDCSMEEGSLRVDANLSVRGRDGAPGIPTEIKNLNSFAGVERALRWEWERQSDRFERGEPVERITLHWDAARGEARPLRSKEEAHDYRFFPEPDLPPLVIGGESIDAARRDLPELPWERTERLRDALGLPPALAEALCAAHDVADYFEAVVAAGAEPRASSSWVQGEVRAMLRRRGGTVAELRVRPEGLAALIADVVGGTLTRTAAKQVLERMADTGESAAEAARRAGLRRQDDPDALDAWVEGALDGHPVEAARYRDGESRLLDFFLGAVMRASRGRADPRAAADRLRRRLEAPS